MEMSICNIFIHQIICAVQKPQVFITQPMTVHQHALNYSLYPLSSILWFYAWNLPLRDMPHSWGTLDLAKFQQIFYEITTLEISYPLKKKNKIMYLVMFYRCAISTTVRPTRQTDMQYPPKYFKMSGIITLENTKRSLFKCFQDHL